MTRVLVIADRASALKLIADGFADDDQSCAVVCVDGVRPCDDPIRLAKPDVILVDEMSAPGRAVARIREARLNAPKAKVLLLAGRMHTANVSESIDAGAHGAIGKGLGQRAIAAIAHAMLAGKIYHVFEDRPAPVELPRHSELTPRELEILRFVAEGTSNARIAQSLWVTEQTVKFHLSNVYRKLGVANRTEASHYAHVHGLVADRRALAATPLAEAA